MRVKTTLIGVDRSARLVRKALLNSTLVLLLSALYLILIKMLSHFTTPSAPVGHMLATIVVAILVVPIRTRVGLLVNRVLHREWQGSQELLSDIGVMLSRTINPDALRTILVDDLPNRLCLQGATLWMLEPPDDHAFVALSRPHDSLGATLLANGASARQLRHTSQYLLVPTRPSVEWAPPFMAQGVRLVIPLRVGNRLVGIYGCGSPVNGDLYPEQVVKILLMLAPSVASALENARAYTTISRLNAQLRALDQLKDEFIQSVGHELRTPLTSLSLAMQLLGRQSELTPTLAQVTRTGVMQLQALVERVLTFDQNLYPPPEEQRTAGSSVELAPLLESIAEGYAPTAEAKGVQFVLDIPAGLFAWGHPANLRRALHEVVDNAVRYSEGGIVTLSAMRHDGLAVVSISDEGPGIPQEERDRLFAAFYRGSSTRSLSGTPGAGLGLSIARRDVEALGGRIWLERSGPDGSMMCVALPVAQAQIADTLPVVQEYARVVGG